MMLRQLDADRVYELFTCAVSAADTVNAQRYVLNIFDDRSTEPMTDRHPLSREFHRHLMILRNEYLSEDYVGELFTTSPFNTVPWCHAMLNVENELQRIQRFANGTSLYTQPVAMLYRAAAYALVASTLYEFPEIGSEKGILICQEKTATMGDLHDMKSEDYGRDTDPFANMRASNKWGIKTWVGAMLRASDKVARLGTFAIKGALVNESAADSLIDFPVYCLIAIVLFDEQQATPVTVNVKTNLAYSIRNGY